MKDIVAKLADGYEDVIIDLFDAENLHVNIDIHIIDFEKPDKSVGIMGADWSHDWKEKIAVTVSYKLWFEYVKHDKVDMNDVELAKHAYQKFIGRAFKNIGTLFDNKYYGVAELTLKKIGFNGLEFELDKIEIDKATLSKFDHANIDSKWLR